MKSQGYFCFTIMEESSACVSDGTANEGIEHDSQVFRSVEAKCQNWSHISE